MIEARLKTGKYRGQLWSRIPLGYLKFLIRIDAKDSDRAKRELDRRGTIVDNEVELTKHAIDRASVYCFESWRRKKNRVGLYTWLHDRAVQAIKNGDRRGENIYHNGIKFVFDLKGIQPTLITVFQTTING